ncbi:MAG: hypothetical protein QM737_02825 [Ferruginibacter sp.]
MDMGVYGMMQSFGIQMESFIEEHDELKKDKDLAEALDRQIRKQFSTFLTETAKWV